MARRCGGAAAKAACLLGLLALAATAIPAFVVGRPASGRGGVSASRRVAESGPRTRRGLWESDGSGDLPTTSPDLFLIWYFVTMFFIAIYGFWAFTKGYWENRWLVEKINAQKLKFVAQDSGTPLDRYELGRLYVTLKDFPSALAEFDEVEEDFDEVKPFFDPQDTLGALAARGQLHNSKGYSLMQLEPPRTAQARREFVRSITYWPEYPEALANVGKELIKRKRYDVAMRTLNTALKWQPGNDKFQEVLQEAKDGIEGNRDDDPDEEDEDAKAEGKKLAEAVKQ